MIPSDNLGRGLIKKNGEIYEFQTAYPCQWANVNNFIRNICNKLNEVIKDQAKKIAILPEHVRMEHIESAINGIKNVPIGIEKNTLKISTFNFDKSPISIVSAQDDSLIGKFIMSLGQVFQKMPSVELYMFDLNQIVEEKEVFKNYFADNYQSMLLNLEQASQNTNKTHVFIINGFDTFENGLSSNEQKQFKDLLHDIKSKQNIRIVMVDAISKIKTYEYEDFYRTNVEPTNAIWVGSGITEQFTIKSSTYNKETRSQIPNDFGYNVKQGSATLIKLLDFYTEE